MPRTAVHYAANRHETSRKRDSRFGNLDEFPDSDRVKVAETSVPFVSNVFDEATPEARPLVRRISDRSRRFESIASVHRNRKTDRPVRFDRISLSTAVHPSTLGFPTSRALFDNNANYKTPWRTVYETFTLSP